MLTYSVSTTSERQTNLQTHQRRCWMPAVSVSPPTDTRFRDTQRRARFLKFSNFCEQQPELHSIYGPNKPSWVSSTPFNQFAGTETFQDSTQRKHLCSMRIRWPVDCPRSNKAATKNLVNVGDRCPLKFRQGTATNPWGLTSSRDFV